MVLHLNIKASLNVFEKFIIFLNYDWGRGILVCRFEGRLQRF